MSYREVFPNFDPADMPVIPAGFEDQSWLADGMPRFVDEARSRVIWVNYPDPDAPAGRDFRFLLETLFDDGMPREAINFSDWQALLKEL